MVLHKQLLNQYFVNKSWFYYLTNYKKKFSLSKKLDVLFSFTLFLIQEEISSSASFSKLSQSSAVDKKKLFLISFWVWEYFKRSSRFLIFVRFIFSRTFQN